MKTFCVAYFNGHAGELTQTIVQAIHGGNAVIDFLISKGYDLEKGFTSEDTFLDFCSNCDIWVEAIDITNVKIL